MSDGFELVTSGTVYEEMYCKGDCGFTHADPHIKMYSLPYNGHRVDVTYDGSYSVRIDGVGGELHMDYGQMTDYVNKHAK